MERNGTASKKFFQEILFVGETCFFFLFVFYSNFISFHHHPHLKIHSKTEKPITFYTQSNSNPAEEVV